MRPLSNSMILLTIHTSLNRTFSKVNNVKMKTMMRVGPPDSKSGMGFKTRHPMEPLPVWFYVLVYRLILLHLPCNRRPVRPKLTLRDTLVDLVI